MALLGGELLCFQNQPLVACSTIQLTPAALRSDYTAHTGVGVVATRELQLLFFQQFFLGALVNITFHLSPSYRAAKNNHAFSVRGSLM